VIDAINARSNDVRILFVSFGLKRTSATPQVGVDLQRHVRIAETVEHDAIPALAGAERGSHGCTHRGEGDRQIRTIERMCGSPCGCATGRDPDSTPGRSALWCCRMPPSITPAASRSSRAVAFGGASTAHVARPHCSRWCCGTPPRSRSRTRSVPTAMATADLVRVVTQALERGGTLVVPSFAIGGTPEIIWRLSDPPRMGRPCRSRGRGRASMFRRMSGTRRRTSDAARGPCSSAHAGTRQAAVTMRLWDCYSSRGGRGSGTL